MSNNINQQLVEGLTKLSKEIVDINNIITQLDNLKVSDNKENISIVGNYELNNAYDTINIGYNTLNNITAGESNIVLGNNTLTNLSDGSNNIFIGSSSDVSNNDSIISNTISIGKNNILSTSNSGIIKFSPNRI